MQHLEIGKKIWQTLVPRSGQADTIQGELLRAIEKLRDEAQRNGNINYGDSHRRLAEFIVRTLNESGFFDKTEKIKIDTEMRKLMHASSPYLYDDVYDFISNQICVFYLKTPVLIKHDNNPEIYC
jgi:hypothetical protein